MAIMAKASKSHFDKLGLWGKELLFFMHDRRCKNYIFSSIFGKLASSCTRVTGAAVVKHHPGAVRMIDNMLSQMPAGKEYGYGDVYQ
jgi:hypothetical protein